MKLIPAGRVTLLRCIHPGKLPHQIGNASINLSPRKQGKGVTTRIHLFQRSSALRRIGERFRASFWIFLSTVQA
jgi:hypothetical protein